jgi:hypothetical protein
MTYRTDLPEDVRTLLARVRPFLEDEDVESASVFADNREFGLAVEVIHAAIRDTSPSLDPETRGLLERLAAEMQLLP